LIAKCSSSPILPFMLLLDACGFAGRSVFMLKREQVAQRRKDLPPVVSEPASRGVSSVLLQFRTKRREAGGSSAYIFAFLLCVPTTPGAHDGRASADEAGSGAGLESGGEEQSRIGQREHGTAGAYASGPRIHRIGRRNRMRNGAVRVAKTRTRTSAPSAAAALGAASTFGLGASVAFALDPVRSLIFPIAGLACRVLPAPPGRLWLSALEDPSPVLQRVIPGMALTAASAQALALWL
jgi:hypothetical protein